MLEERRRSSSLHHYRSKYGKNGGVQPHYSRALMRDATVLVLSADLCIYDRAPAKIFEKTCFWFGATSYTTLLGGFETRLVENRHPAWWCHLIQGERQAYVPQHQRVWFHVSAGTHACAGSTLTATGALNMCFVYGMLMFFRYRVLTMSYHENTQASIDYVCWKQGSVERKGQALAPNRPEARDEELLKRLLRAVSSISL